MPQISIILPTYNVEKYLARALDTCINQSFKNIEIIVVDDFGSDKSIEIAKDYAKKDKRIKIIHNERNLGLLKARYEGAKIAGGGYILFLDPDDFLEVDACEKIWDFVKKHEDTQLLFFNAVVESAEPSYRKLNLQSELYDKKDFLRHLLVTKNLYWTMWGKLMKKELYLEAFESLILKPSDKINMAEDALVYYPMVNLARKIGYLDENLYHYVTNDTSLCNAKDEHRIYNNIKEQYLVLAYLKSNFFENEHCEALYLLIKYSLLNQIYKLKKKNFPSTLLRKVHILSLKALFKCKRKVFLKKL